MPSNKCDIPTKVYDVVPAQPPTNIPTTTPTAPLVPAPVTRHIDLVDILPANKTHQEIDSHIADLSIHFIQADIQIVAAQVTDLYTELAPRLLPDIDNTGLDENKALLAGALAGSAYWGTIDHTKLLNIGTNSHADIDIEITKWNIKVPNVSVSTDSMYLRGWLTGNKWEVIDHLAAANIGVKTHTEIDAFIDSGVGTGLNKVTLFDQVAMPDIISNPELKVADIWHDTGASGTAPYNLYIAVEF